MRNNIPGEEKLIKRAMQKTKLPDFTGTILREKKVNQFPALFIRLLCKWPILPLFPIRAVFKPRFDLG